jgi:hypothetical protein
LCLRPWADGNKGYIDGLGLLGLPVVPLLQKYPLALRQGAKPA